MLLRRECGPFDIDKMDIGIWLINLPLSGIIRTALADALGSPDQVNQHLVSKTALGRIGEPEDIARVILFLFSDQSAYISGSVSGHQQSLFSDFLLTCCSQVINIDGAIEKGC